MIVVAARSAGIDAIDAPCFDIHNHDLLARESAQARRLGFSGKSALHPDQLAVINQTFDVTPEEIAWAERIIAELDEADRRGKALTTVDGNLIDNPHRAAAERILSAKNRSDRPARKLPAWYTMHLHEPEAGGLHPLMLRNLVRRHFSSNG